ncbi:methylesterase 2-like [Quercus suber]|uniref:methylesterase 2-like n=1 Tax=Quercus suber TaxID=58331 RepID=UPI0032E00E17
MELVQAQTTVGSVGHQVTALDLAASGINMKAIQDVHTMYEYTKASNYLCADLAHSLGGLNLALAMDKYPEKVAVGVFMVTFMTDTKHEFPDKAMELVQAQTTVGSVGHQVTALDLAASGINMKAIQDVHTMYEYTKASNYLCADLAHSLGGLNLALAMDKYPEKVAVGVFMVTFMTDTKHEFPDKVAGGMAD